MSPDFTASSSDAKSLRNCVRCDRRLCAPVESDAVDVSVPDTGYHWLVLEAEPTHETDMTLPQRKGSERMCRPGGANPEWGRVAGFPACDTALPSFGATQPNLSTGALNGNKRTLRIENGAGG